MFMRDVLKYDLDTSGILAAFPYILMAIVVQVKKSHNYLYSQSVAGAATDDTSHVLLCGSRDSQHKPQSESFVISQPSLGFSPNQT